MLLGKWQALFPSVQCGSADSNALKVRSLLHASGSACLSLYSENVQQTTTGAAQKPLLRQQ
jgi:hypothetical protein